MAKVNRAISAIFKAFVVFAKPACQQAGPPNLLICLLLEYDKKQNAKALATSAARNETFPYNVLPTTFPKPEELVLNIEIANV